MDIGTDLLLPAIALIVALVFWRQVLTLALILLLIGILTVLWKSQHLPNWLKTVATVSAFFAVGWIAQKFKLDKEKSPMLPKRSLNDPTYKPVCVNCSGTGTRRCIACNGSGEGPGSLGLALGTSVPCSYCNLIGNQPQ